MTRRDQPSENPRRKAAFRGFTLVEMVLVLAILGVIVGITWPNLQRFLMDQRISEATEMVRAHLGGTRNKAIDAMLIYEFRYEVGGNRFLVVPHEAYDLEATTAAVDAQGQVATGDQLYRYAGILRDGVKFAVATVDLSDLGIPVIEEVVPIADWQLQGLPAADELAGAKWSNPILFYPDGSANQSALRLEDEFGHQMQITVRGLTGTVSSGSVVEETQL